MPVTTRSFNNFANSIINNIVENAFIIITSRSREVDEVEVEVEVGGATSVSASLGLDCCSICLEDIQSEKGRFVLECGHAFHSKCILVSFQHGNRCPNCRTEVKESNAHERSYAMPTSLQMYSSIIHDAADHFVHDLGNITLANVVHRMMLLSSENQDLRRIQYPYIKRLLVQFASMLIGGVAFTVRDHGTEIQDPVPINIINNMIEDEVGGGDPDYNAAYDAALSNPALDAAVAYHAIITTDMNFDSSSHVDNVGSALIRRSMTLAEMGLQRSELSLRRASRAALRRQQMQEVQRLLQEAVREREQAQQAQQAQQVQQNINIVISEHEEEEDDDSNPYGLEF
jgi:hypothetical protein